MALCWGSNFLDPPRGLGKGSESIKSTGSEVNRNYIGLFGA